MVIPRTFACWPRIWAELRKSAVAGQQWVMPVMHGNVLIWAMCVAGLLALTRANATTVVPPTFEEMANRADLVFVGKVVGSHAEWRVAGSNQVIFTLVEFHTEEILKGTASASVSLRFLGGTVGGVTLEVVGVPKFKAGDRVLLFVEGNGVQFCPLVGVYHGMFGVRKEDKGNRDTVFMHDGKPLRDVAEIGAGEGAQFGPKRARLSIPAEREPMSLDDFKAHIRSHLAKKTVR
jgi:hypothetical protein